MHKPLQLPPELHGQHLTGFERTTNHDLFGLAQLIFLLLFTGRHPFAGVPKGARQLQPEEAIRERAFAFAPSEYNVPLDPPPGSPTLSCLPSDFRSHFVSAFIAGTTPNARPTAVRWKAALETLSRELVACGRHRNHMFWKGAAACPWCQVLSRVGIEIFPAADVQRVPVNCGNTYVAGLTSVRPRRFLVFAPAFLTDLTPASLPPEPKGFFIRISKVFAGGGWRTRWLNGVLKDYQRLVTNAEAALSQIELEQKNAIATYENAFAATRTTLQELVRQIQNPLMLRRDVEAVVSRDRRQTELRLFLQGKQLRRASIPNVGPGRTATLISYGIQTAADVSYQAVFRIPGFGHALSSDIARWRTSCEGEFRFDPSRPLSTALRQEIERQVQKKLALLKEDVAKSETDLQKAEMLCVDALRKQQVEAIRTGRQRDQARVDAAFIQAELARA